MKPARIEETLAHAPRRRRLFAGLLGAALIAVACGAPESEEIEGWDTSDETRVERLDHGAWQDILDGYVGADSSGVNLVDYEALAASAKDTAKLAGYLEYLQGLDPQLDRSESRQIPIFRIGCCWTCGRLHAASPQRTDCRYRREHRHGRRADWWARRS